LKLNPIFVRADSTARIGAGHLMRCLALAQAWQDKGGNATFISHCESASLRQRLVEEGMEFIPIEKPYPATGDVERTLDILDAASVRNGKTAIWLAIDGYHFDSAYQKRIKDAGYKLLWIDDYGHADYYHADLVLNQNISADESFYAHREPYTRLLLGPRYALLRREFRKWQGWKREIPVVAGKVLVTLGGADPDNVTLKVIKALKEITISDLEVKVVIGPANPNKETLEQEVASKPNFKLPENVTNMPELMAWADIAVTAGGSTCLEMAIMGLPNIVIVLAENQRPIAEKLHVFGAVLNLGWSTELPVGDIMQAVNLLLLSQEKREQISIQGKELVDWDGGRLVCQEMMQIL
jgi:UDP-2,4-diacetamido-2,4,6-trideoxy-beta-L-altropyranose hydrolase